LAVQVPHSGPAHMVPGEERPAPTFAVCPPFFAGLGRFGWPVQLQQAEPADQVRRELAVGPDLPAAERRERAFGQVEGYRPTPAQELDAGSDRQAVRCGVPVRAGVESVGSTEGTESAEGSEGTAHGGVGLPAQQQALGDEAMKAGRLLAGQPPGREYLL